MKKIALLLALVLIMGCAYAEPVLMNSFVNVDLVFNSNLLYSRGHNGYALMDYEGNLLTEDIYNGFNYNGGMVSCYLANAEGVNRRGILKDDGSVILPFKYGDVNILSEDWIYGVVLKEATRDNFEYEITIGEEKAVYQIDYVDIINLNTGKMLTLTRENFEEIHANGYTVSIKDRSTGKVSCYDQDFNVLGTDLNSVYSTDYATYDFHAFYDHGRYGVKDAQGNVFVEPAYDRIYYDQGEYALIEDLNERTGAMDLQGNVVLEPQFDDLEYMRYLPHREYSYGYAGYFCFIQDGKIGYATSAGITCEPKYSEDILDCNGVSSSFTDLEGNYNIMAADGVITTITGYRDVSPASFAGGFYYTVSNEDYDDGLIDWHGNVIFPCEYNSIEFSVDGQYVLVSPEYGKYEIYTLNQAEAAAPAVEAPAAEAPVAEAPVAEVPTGNSAAALLQKVKSGMGTAAAPAAEEPVVEAPAAEAPAAEAPAAEAPADNSAAVALLQSVKALVTADAAANAGAIATLLDSAIAMIPGSPALGMLDSVKALLAVDAAANAGAVATLLDSAIAML